MIYIVSFPNPIFVYILNISFVFVLKESSSVLLFYLCTIIIFIIVYSLPLLLKNYS